MDMSKYRFYTNNKDTVVAVSSYAGKTVRGVAKCNAVDTFDLEKGKALAAARCNLKVAYKRRQRAVTKYREACQNLQSANLQLDKMAQYYTEANRGLMNAVAELDGIVDTM